MKRKNKTVLLYYTGGVPIGFRRTCYIIIQSIITSFFTLSSLNFLDGIELHFRNLIHCMCIFIFDTCVVRRDYGRKKKMPIILTIHFAIVPNVGATKMRIFCSQLALEVPTGLYTSLLCENTAMTMTLMICNMHIRNGMTTYYSN